MKKTKAELTELLKKISIVFFDIFAVNLAYAAGAIVLEPYQITKTLKTLFGTMPGSLIRIVILTTAYLFVFKLFGIYKNIWKYAGLYEMVQIVLASVMGGIVNIGAEKIAIYFEIRGISNRSSLFYINTTLFLIFIIGGSRLIVREMARKEKFEVFPGRTNKKNVMIVGAGIMGMIVASDLQANSYRFGSPVVMVDDNINKQGKRVRGIPIRGGCENIPELAKEYKIDEIILCVPSAPAERQVEILKIAMKTGCTLKRSPSLLEMREEDIGIRQIRDVEITDLLSRPEVKLDTEVCGYLKNVTLLVTGGGGSIGSELCRQAALYSPKRIIIFDNYENNAFELQNQLQRAYPDGPEVIIRIGSVQDTARLKEVFEEFRPGVVFHAAAHKHVPLMEESPCEAIKNNIFGTLNTAKTAMEYGAKKFILLSTDKAVNPANVMGATKRVTEKIIQYMDSHTTGTHFAAVRFGNVLGSNGSVIPIFKEQIKQGGPVTVTDAAITRYFMTIPEAAQLVVQAGGLSQGGEVFVLDMGETVKILTMAENLIRLSGLTPYVDIDIEFVGLRPGEKLYEELALSEEMETRKRTANDRIYVTLPTAMDEEEFLQTLKKLKTADADNARKLLKIIVPNFKENNGCGPEGTTPTA